MRVLDNCEQGFILRSVLHRQHLYFFTEAFGKCSPKVEVAVIIVRMLIPTFQMAFPFLKLNHKFEREVASVLVRS